MSQYLFNIFIFADSVALTSVTYYVICSSNASFTELGIVCCL